MTFHIRISIEGMHDDIVKLDLSKEELLQRIVEPYEQGEPIVIGGVTVIPASINKIKIAHTKETSDQLLPQIRYSLATSRVRAPIRAEWYVVERGEDVTDDYITMPPGSRGKFMKTVQDTPVKDTRKVFVVHGRNQQVRDAMFQFLRAIKLDPIEWSEAVAATGKAAPFIGEVLDKAFTEAQAIVVLFTPDDVACLQKPYRGDHEPAHETELTPQARPNVLFEAGMAIGRSQDRTVLVEIGTLRPFSDLAGRHAVKLDDSPEKRKSLAQRLGSAGCPVSLIGDDWLRVGNFEIPIPIEKYGESPALRDASKHVKVVGDSEIADLPIVTLSTAIEGLFSGNQAWTLSRIITALSEEDYRPSKMEVAAIIGSLNSRGVIKPYHLESGAWIRNQTA